jgi:hypothetical protein
MYDQDPADFLDHLRVMVADVVCTDNDLGPGGPEPGAGDRHNAIGRPLSRRLAEGRDDRVKGNSRGGPRPFQVPEEGVVPGFCSGLRFLSLMMLGIGLTVAILLARAARGLQAPPGSGYT